MFGCFCCLCHSTCRHMLPSIGNMCFFGHLSFGWPFLQWKDEEKAWVCPCEVMCGVFWECHKLWKFGAEHSSMKKILIPDATQLMWGVIQTLVFLEDFVHLKFVGHAIHSLGTVKDNLSEISKNLQTIMNLGQQWLQLQKLGFTTWTFFSEKRNNLLNWQISSTIFALCLH